MKLNKSKGKVHPSPSSSSSSSSSSNSTDPVSALNLLLPAAILTLISALSLQDREVLAYMITRSLKSTSTSAAALPLDHHRKQQKSKKSPLNHKSPSFDCGCFECYTTYWFRWDSSPHRELIHQAIEAFEEHLATTEQAKKSGGGRSRRREKERAPPPIEAAATVTVSRKSPVHPLVVVAEEESAEDISPKSVPEIAPPTPEREDSAAESVAREKATVAETEERENGEVEEMSGAHQQQQQQHKGLARKVLPDVIGLFNSRLWNLWGPNV